MRILFMGTGDIALPAFKALLTSDYEILGLVTQPDKPVGRKQILTAPRIKEVALEAGLPVWQPQRAGSRAFLDEITALAPDLIVVMAYGQILKERLLQIPRRAILNVHASLLPKYRGASCIQAPIKNGDPETGVTIMHVVKALDAGDIVAQRKTPLSPCDTGGQVHDRLAEATPEVLLRVLAEMSVGALPATPQDEAESSYAPKLHRADGKLDFTQSAAALERTIRAYDPWPGTYCEYEAGPGKKEQKGKTQRRLKFFPPSEVSTESHGTPGEVIAVEEERFGIACGEGILWVREVQPEGRRRMLASEFLKGAGLQAGVRLSGARL